MREWTAWRSSLRHAYRLRAPRTVELEWKRQTCGGTGYAFVELAFAPAVSFAFTTTCNWPNQNSRESWQPAIIAGIWDALQPQDGDPYAATGVAVTCKRVQRDEVKSSAVAFYKAAWDATNSLRQDAQAWALVPDSGADRAAEE